MKWSPPSADSSRPLTNRASPDELRLKEMARIRLYLDTGHV